jgi:aryl-alcohol dehydrogenase-like predicted oxidoreductase
MGAGFMAYAPLARGLLSGGITKRADLTDDDWRLTQPRFAPGALESNIELAQRLGVVAQRIGITLPQLATAWVLAQGPSVQALIGTKRRTHLAENLAAASVTLSPDDIAAVDAVLAEQDVVGDRYSDMSHVDI